MITTQYRIGKIKRRKAPYLSLYESARMFDRAFERVFCANRPWLKRSGLDPVLDGTFQPAPANATAEAVAKHYLAIEHRPRGLLMQMAQRAHLEYAAVANAVTVERKRQRASA